MVFTPRGHLAFRKHKSRGRRTYNRRKAKKLFFKRKCNMKSERKIMLLKDFVTEGSNGRTLFRRICNGKHE